MRSPTLPHLQRPARAAAALALATSLVAGCSAVSSDDSAPAGGATESQALRPFFCWSRNTSIIGASEHMQVGLAVMQSVSETKCDGT